MKIIFAKILSVILRSFFRVRYFGHVKFGKGVVLNWRFKFRGKGRISIEDNVNLWAHEEWNRFFTYSSEAEIRIGARSRLNGVTVQCKKSVKIGSDCLVGSCMLIDTDFHSVYFEHRNDPEHVKSAGIVVEDKVWLAGQSVLLKGVRVGREAVVGFRAVVTKDVPGRCVVAGNPAKVVREHL